MPSQNPTKLSSSFQPVLEDPTLKLALYVIKLIIKFIFFVYIMLLM